MHLLVPRCQEPSGPSVIDPARVLRQVALLRNGIEADEEREPLVGDQRHHVAPMFQRPELEGEARPEGMSRRNHLGAGDLSRVRELIDAETHEVGDKQEQAAAGGHEPSGRKVEQAGIGDGLNHGTGPIGSFLVEPTRQRREPLRLEHFTDGRRAERQPFLLEHLADLVDRVVLLAERDDALARRGLPGLAAGTGLRRDEEDGVRFPTEVVAEDLERPGRVAEGACDLGGRAVLHKIGTERLVLTLPGGPRREEELLAIA